MAAEQAQPIGPFGGLNNTDNPLVIAATDAQDLLNVDVTPGGKSFKKRKGFGLQFNLAITTSATHGIYNFYDANGNDVSLFFHDRIAQGSVGGATPTTLFSTATVAATWQCVDSLGFAYCGSSARDPIQKTNGQTSNALAGAPAGYIIAATPERLLVAGTSATPQRINFSKANDFTTWTVGGADTDPNTEDITSPGSKITHVTYAFGRIMWFKDASFGAILGTNNSNWQIITISPTLGTLDNTSVYRDGILYFRGQDGHMYGFDGSTAQKLTRAQTTTILASQSRRSNQYSQSSQSDWQSGTIVPTGQLSTTIAVGDIVPSSFTRTFTTDADFSSGTFNSTQFLNNTIVISTTNTDVSNNSFEGSLNQWTNGGLWSASNSGFSCPTTGQSGTYWAQSGGDGSLSGSTLSSFLIDSQSGVTLTTGPVITHNGTNSCSWTQRTITGNTAYARKLVKIKFQGSAAAGIALTSDNFYYNGRDITFYTFNKDNDVNATVFGVDAVTDGKSTISSGTWTSPVLDTGMSPSYVTAASSTTVDDFTPAFSIQDSTSANGPWAQVSTGTADIAASMRRYVRFISSMTSTGSSDAASTLNDVTFTARSSGTYYSPVRNVPSLTSWDTLGATKQDNGGSHTFYMRSSTNTFSVLSSTPSWVAQTVGAQISASTGTYFQVRDDFALDVSTDIPTLSDFTVNWFEGTASDKAYATYHDNAVWWAIASGAGATGNNYILRYDLINGLWTLYDIAANGFLVRNQALYFGSSSAGKIFKFGDVDNDNSAAINAYWKSKDFFGTSPFQTNEYRSLSLSAASVTNSSMTVTYTINGSSSTAYTVYGYDANSSFLKHNKNLPLGRNGSYFNVKVGNNAADQPFEVFGLQYTFEPKPWMPTQ